MNPQADEVPVFAPASHLDLPAITDIGKGSPEPWTLAALEAELAHEPATLFVLRASDRVAAFAVARIHPPDMDVLNIAVAPDRRRKGLGRLLVRSLLEEAKRAGASNVFLEVREGNLEARGLYRNCGFAETQKRPRFYRNPTEDAVLMALKIEP